MPSSNRPRQETAAGSWSAMAMRTLLAFALGNLIATIAVAVALPRGGLLLAVLVLPLSIPVLIFGVGAVEAVIGGNLEDQTRRVLKTLTPREEKVLRMRFGIGGKSDHTLEEVGQDFEVTRERIRQIEAKALRKLRHPSRSKQLRSFMDN